MVRSEREFSILYRFILCFQFFFAGLSLFLVLDFTLQPVFSPGPQLGVRPIFHVFQGFTNSDPPGSSTDERD